MAVAFVQGTGAQSSGSVASLAKAFDSNVTAGNLIAVGTVANANTLLTTSVTDDLSNTYTREVFSNGVAAGNAQSAIYIAPNIAGGACTVTLDPSGSDFVSLVIAEFSGCATTSPVDGSNTFSGTSSTPATGTWTAASDGVAFGVFEQNQAATTITTGGTFTQIYENENATNAMPIHGQYDLNTAGAGKSANWTLGVARKSTACGCNLKEGAAPAGGNRRRRVLMGAR